MNATQPIPKQSKRVQAQTEFAKLLSAAETRGFHGTASITVCVQDGHIQHLKVSVERMIK
ncbi:MAG TPA: hypothetical protein VF175_04345 [Lacipirellula sp.]